MALQLEYSVLDILINVTRIANYPIVTFVGCHSLLFPVYFGTRDEPSGSCMIGSSIALGSTPSSPFFVLRDFKQRKWRKS